MSSSRLYPYSSALSLPAYLAENKARLIELEGHLNTTEQAMQTLLMDGICTPAQYAAFSTENEAPIKAYTEAKYKYDCTSDMIRRIETTMATDKFKADYQTEADLANKAAIELAEEKQARLVWSTKVDEPFPRSDVIKPGVAMNFIGHPFQGGRTYTVTNSHVGHVLMPSVVNEGQWWIAFDSWVICVPEDELKPWDC